MNDKKIKIIEKTIIGIKNPKLIVNLKISYTNYEVKVFEDDKEIEYTKNLLNNNDIILIQSDLEKSNSKIKVIIKINNKNEIVINLKNNIVTRTLSKSKAIFRQIGFKLKNCIIGRICQVTYRGIRLLWREHHFLVPPSMMKKYFKVLIERLKHGYNTNLYNPLSIDDYNKWLLTVDESSDYKELKYKPLISIVIPVYNIGREYLSDCLNSILKQKYTNFEVCLADDCSTKEETKETLEEFKKKDKRIKVKYRKENGHISKATNTAIELATGEFIALMDNDDIIPENALYEFVKVLNENKDIDMIYSDEDKLTMEGKRCDPHFKPDYSPDTLLGCNYICHLTMLRKSIVDDLGGFRSEFDGAQDYDMFLRFVEKTDKIYHIPKILYHWRKVPGSTADTIENKEYAVECGRKAVEAAIKRRKLEATVSAPLPFTYYLVKYKVKKEPLISIIIPTKDYKETLEACIDSIYEKTTYKNFEIIICNNNSEKEETFEYFKKIKKEHKNLKVLDCNYEFNFSKINNEAVKAAKGEYILLLNNDTTVITPEWLELMVGYAMQKHIGCVGAKLVYPDNTVQHGGVIVGLGGVASHASIGLQREDYGVYGRLIIPYDYSAVTAACLMISKDIYNKVNGLEEELKVAYNDIDFNLKVLEEGYYNICLPQVELYHYESKSRGLDTTGEKYKRFLKESEYMYKKWSSYIEDDKFYNENLSLKGFMMLDK